MLINGDAKWSSSQIATYDIPAFLRKADAAHEPELADTLSPFDFCDPAHWMSTSEGEGFTPLGFMAWLIEQPASAWPQTYAELGRAGVTKGVVEWLRRDIGGESEETLVVMTFCATMASLAAAYPGHSGGVAATGGLRHGAVLEEAMQHIRSAIGVSGSNRWPQACLQE